MNQRERRVLLANAVGLAAPLLFTAGLAAGCSGVAPPATGDDAGGSELDALVGPDVGRDAAPSPADAASGADAFDGGAGDDGGAADAAVDDAAVDDAAVVPNDVGVDAACGCDDGVSCTIDRCTPLGCLHEVDYTSCPSSLYCDPARGCVGAAVCSSAASCAVGDPCIVASCDTATATCRYAALDADRDGSPPLVCGGGDCNDSSAAIGPTRIDGCNAVDDDCDGRLDEAAACSDGYHCVAGACACPGPWTLCSQFPRTWCADLQSDLSDCGVCGRRCATGATCTAGVCECPAATPTACSGRCVDLASDAHACGVCGTDCGTGVCNAGACECPAPLTQCSLGSRDSTCFDLENDPLNCGACGHRCLTNATCVAGRCSMEAEWIVGLGTASSASRPNELDVAPNGDIYVVPMNGGRDLSRPASAPPLFTGVGVVRITPDGVVASGANIGNSVLAATSAGYVVADWFVGTYSGVAMAGLVCPLGLRCMAVVGLDSTHHVLWSRMTVGTYTAPPYVTDMERVGDLVVAVGSFSGPIDLGGGVLADDGTTPGFVWTFDARDGSYVRAFRVPGSPAVVHTRADESVLVSANFSGTITVGGVTFAARGVGPYYVARFSTTGVATSVHPFDGGFGSFEPPWPTAVDGDDDAVSRVDGQLIRVFDGSDALVGSFAASTGLVPWWLEDTGASLVSVGTGDGTAIGGVMVPATSAYILRLGRHDASFGGVASFTIRGQRGRARAVDADHIVVAVPALNLSLGSVSMSTRSSDSATFIARIRIR